MSSGGNTTGGLAGLQVFARLPAPGRAVLDNLFSIDLRALAAFRIGLALLILGDLIGRVQDAEAHYTDFGVMTREAVLLYDPDRWSLSSPYMWVDGVGPVVALMALAFGFALCLLVGYKTRFVALVSYFLLCSVQNRNPIILHGGDMATRLMLFWSLFTPMGARFSLDGIIAQARAEGKAAPTRALSFGTAGLLLQLAAIYWFTVLLKNSVEWRRDGTALYYALAIEQYATPIGQWFRGLHEWLRPFSYGTLALEFFGSLLIFSPVWTARLRTAIALIFIFFHLILLNLCFDLGPFPFISTVGWLVFLPSPFWDWLGVRWQAARQTRLKSSVEAGVARVARLQADIVQSRIRRGKVAPSLSLGVEWQVTALFFLVYIGLWNIRTVAPERQGLVPAPVEFLARSLRIDQAWGMFAPRPMTDDGWFVMPAKLTSGQEIDLFTRHASVDWSRPRLVSTMYKNERWRKYLMNLWGTRYIPQRPNYAAWVCRDWNRSHSGGEHLQEFYIYYMRRDNLPGYAESTPAKVLMWHQSCTDTATNPQPAPKETP